MKIERQAEFCLHTELMLWKWCGARTAYQFSIVDLRRDLGEKAFAQRAKGERNADPIPLEETRRTVEASEEGCTGTPVP